MLVSTKPGLTQFWLESTPMTNLLVLLDGVEDAEAGVAGGGEDDVRALADLRHRQLLALARVVPGRLGDADVVRDDPDRRD